jgi:hypothetical protein
MVGEAVGLKDFNEFNVFSIDIFALEVRIECDNHNNLAMGFFQIRSFPGENEHRYYYDKIDSHMRPAEAPRKRFVV